MILAFLVACSAAQGESPPLVLAPQQGVGFVCVQAAIKLPPLSPEDRFAMRTLAGTLFSGTKEYSKYRLRDYGGQTGRPPFAVLMPDSLRVEMSFPPDQLDTAISMLDSVLRRADLEDSALAEAARKVAGAKGSYWAEALWPEKADRPDILPARVRFLYGLLIRPDTVTLAVGGAFDPAEAEKLWRPRLDAWAAETRVRERAPRPDPREGRMEPYIARSAALTTVELAAPPFSAKDVELSTRLLAVFALGCGKESTVFRVLREGLGLCYRQEAVLWPTEEGFRARFIMVQRPTGDDSKRADQMRAAMLKDVEGWTDATFQRALGLAESSLLRGIGPNPITLAPDGPLGDSVEDRTYLQAYWRAKTGLPFEPERMIAQMKLVRLEDLKDRAKEMLANAFGRVMQGRK